MHYNADYKYFTLLQILEISWTWWCKCSKLFL